MIEPIFSSKLFAVSNRKAEIRAAANNPINQNLMQQLSSALDKSYQKSEYLLDAEDQEKLKQEQSADVEPTVDEDVETEVTEEVSAKPEEGVASPAKPSNLHSKFKEAEKNVAESGSPTPNSDTPTDSGVDTTTEASTDIDSGIEDDGILDVRESGEPALSPDAIKTALNNHAETKGVNRTSIKDDELWIYYDDSINLNKVMADAIETIYTFGYGLEFNRLARSDNAIVFLI